MPLLAVLVLAAGTYAFRVAGPLAARRLDLERLRGPLVGAAVVLLLALAVTSAVADGQEFAGWARPAGVAVAAVLAWRRASFVVVVSAAAAVTAGLRLLGVP
ncbi:branched-subunit amino acid transport protein AzlD [Actinocorallia herbida]|uniref:Branched-subunit amino acid transport protein AzlD n=1 Tax=Actinocorallia herbida TaxID=58109 RepID=A0A3N1CVD5_9ACTN|nr:AzlD domain-containing protein [Actinocorallia herbida]ROO84668.1 branched-subunit amino acid transport protein AzlD [Actinocorallia herbida]